MGSHLPSTSPNLHLCGHVFAVFHPSLTQEGIYHLTSLDQLAEVATAVCEGGFQESVF